MPCSTAAIFGADSAIWSVSLSPPPGLAKFERQAVPIGSSRPSPMHVVAAPTRPTSLPPMPTVTSAVSLVSAENCGTLAPPVTACEPSMSFVVADEQLTSRNAVEPSAARTTDG